tara:strand:- start:261 stop:485 length:225 start_codon:yes stop_codon:yes gene_type:complete
MYRLLTNTTEFNLPLTISNIEELRPILNFEEYDVEYATDEIYFYVKNYYNLLDGTIEDLHENYIDLIKISYHAK